MKRTIYIMGLVVILTLVLGVGTIDADSKGKKKRLAVGDEVYACGCGSTCCEYIAYKPGKCSCDADLAKATVAKVEKGKVTLKIGDKEQSFKTSKPKYVCACGEKCTCGAMSQKAGKCSCGTDMKQKMKKKKA